MNNLEVFKLASDALLLISLAWLCFRFLRSGAPSATGRLAELESELRSLLREAESSSQALAERLTKRQKDLEKLLYDLETVEHRLSRSVTSAEARKGEIEEICHKAEEARRRLDSSVQQVPVQAAGQSPAVAGLAAQSVMASDRTPHATHLEREPLETPASPTLSQAVLPTEAPEPPSFELATPPGVALKNSALLKGRNARSGLAGSIERSVEIDNRPAARRSVHGQVGMSMERIFKAADEAMRAAREVHANEPLLNSAGEIEDSVSIGKNLKAELEAAGGKGGDSKDSRLGVLANIKRQTQIL